MNDVAQSMSRRIAELEAENAALKARLAEAERQASDARVSWGVLSRVVAERKRQDERWGPAHDDEHTTADFVRFIEHYAGLARDAEIQADPDEARKRLVQVAALAVAAAESIERKFLRCPAPLMGDDGTVADCIAKGHCGCDAKSLVPSGGSETGVSAHTGATKATDGTTPKATDQ